MLNSLGNTTNKVTPDNGKAKAVRSKRYRLQRIAGNILGDEWRVSWCMSRFKGDTIAGMYKPSEGRGFVDGLARCGSLWTCPVCAARISEQRRQELKRAVGTKDLVPILCTITLQHDRDDKLDDLVDSLNDAFRRLKMGKGWQLIVKKFGIVAFVTSSEFTWGRSGWHPHKHILFWVQKGEGEFNADEFKTILTKRYKVMLSKHGRYASDLYGLDVRVGDDQVGQYVNKWGLEDELTKAIIKDGKEGGLSPWQLLDLAGQGDKHAVMLFKEYARVTSGRRQLVWSKSGRQVLGLGEDREDQDVVDQSEQGPEDVMLVRLDKPGWSKIYNRKTNIDRRSDFLNVLDTGQLELVLLFCDGLGIVPVLTG